MSWPNAKNDSPQRSTLRARTRRARRCRWGGRPPSPRAPSMRTRARDPRRAGPARGPAARQEEGAVLQDADADIEVGGGARDAEEGRRARASAGQTARVVLLEHDVDPRALRHAVGVHLVQRGAARVGDAMPFLGRHDGPNVPPRVPATRARAAQVTSPDIAANARPCASRASPCACETSSHHRGLSRTSRASARRSRVLACPAPGTRPNLSIPGRGRACAPGRAP